VGAGDQAAFESERAGDLGAAGEEGRDSEDHRGSSSMRGLGGEGAGRRSGRVSARGGLQQRASGVRSRWSRGWVSSSRGGRCRSHFRVSDPAASVMGLAESMVWLGPLKELARGFFVCARMRRLGCPAVSVGDTETVRFSGFIFYLFESFC
jgi:hypothetical protein